MEKLSQYGLALVFTLGSIGYVGTAKAGNLESPVLQISLQEVVDYSQTTAYREYNPLVTPGRDPIINGIVPDGGDGDDGE